MGLIFHGRLLRVSTDFLTVNNIFNGAIQFRFQLLQSDRFLHENNIMTSGIDKFDNHIQHQLRIAEFSSGFGKHRLICLVKTETVILFLQQQGVAEHTPAEIFGDKPQQHFIFIQAVNNRICQIDYLFFQCRQFPAPHLLGCL